MKRHLTTFFLLLSVVILIVGLKLNFQWNGIVSWGLACISLLFSAYFTKYIPNETEKGKSP